MSGWTADRFGARTVFRAAIGVFVLGSIGCALSSSLPQFVLARIVQGMGGAMMTPVGRLVLVRTVDRRELVNAMAWVTIPAMIGPLIGPAARRLHHHLRDLALDLPDQRADRADRHRAGDALHREHPRRGAGALRSSRHGAVRASAVGGLTFGLSVAGFEIVPWPVVVAHHRASARSRSAFYICLRAAGAGADPRFQRCSSCRRSGRAVVGGFLFRIGVGAHAVPAAAAAAGRLPPDAVRVGPDHLHSTAVGALFMKAAAPRMLKRFGFRNVLIANAVLGALSIAACATFTPATPFGDHDRRS